MFSLYCPVLDAEVLRGPRAILSMHNSSEGVVSYVTCQCGSIAVMVTGQLADVPRVHHPAADVPVAVGAGATADCA
ncbi:MAG: hypothetical protein KY461_02845 [Actinobacteria bacterium]|nr:hypothetical protein [Actinomycetota bacterium]